MNLYYLIKKSEITQSQINLSTSKSIHQMRTVVRQSDSIEFVVVEIKEEYSLKDQFIDLQPLTVDDIISEIRDNFIDQ